MSSYTPGPWHAEPDGEHDWRVVSDHYGTIVHRTCYPDPRIDTRVAADARLIAAAPDLLAALRDIAGSTRGEADNVRRIAREAIARSDLSAGHAGKEE